MKPTDRQLAYIHDLCAKYGVQIPKSEIAELVRTSGGASRAIKGLHKFYPAWATHRISPSCSEIKDTLKNREEI